MAEWKRLRLDALAQIVTGATPPAVELDAWGNEVDFITPTDQTGSRDLIPARRLSAAGAERLSRRLVPAGSTALTCIGSTIGKVSQTSRPAVTNQQINSLVASPGVSNADFLYYLVKLWSPSLRAHASGSATPIVNKSVLGAFEFEVPALELQEAIAEVLGALDDKIAANDKTAAASARLAAAIFTRASRLSTRTAKLADLVTTQYGLTASAREHDGPRFLRVMDINKRPWIEWSGVPGCDLSSADLAKYRLNPGDIVVARMADPGKSAMFDRGDPETVFASYLVRLAVHDRSLASYVYYFLNSPAYRRYAEMATTGSVQKNMNARVIVDCEIPLPESHDIATFNASITPLRSQLRAVLAENRRLAQTRDELLPLLMSGKVHVQLDDPSNQLADDEGL